MADMGGKLISSGLRFVVVASRFNAVVVDRLLDGALDAFERTGAQREDVTVVRVPGSFEIPLVARRLATSKKFDGIVALGCVIRGETPHFEYISRAMTNALGTIMLETGVPIGFGVLTVDSVEQAMDRSGLKLGNKGCEAAMATIEMVNLLKQL